MFATEVSSLIKDQVTGRSVLISLRDQLEKKELFSFFPLIPNEVNFFRD